MLPKRHTAQESALVCRRGRHERASDSFRRRSTAGTGVAISGRSAAAPAPRACLHDRHALIARVNSSEQRRLPTMRRVVAGLALALAALPARAGPASMQLFTLAGISSRVRRRKSLPLGCASERQPPAHAGRGARRLPAQTPSR
jgi:hypothetical protein